MTTIKIYQLDVVDFVKQTITTSHINYENDLAEYIKKHCVEKYPEDKKTVKEIINTKGSQYGFLVLL